MGICAARWGRIFNRVTRMGSQIFRYLGLAGIQNGKILVQNIRKLLFVKFNNKLVLTALHSVA